MSAWEGTEYGEKLNDKKKLAPTPEEKQTNAYLNNWLQGSERRTGRSTRMIDEMVQQLFSQGYTVVCDHAHKVDVHGRAENMALSHTEDILFSRLYREHHFRKNVDYHYDQKTNILKLKNYEQTKGK